MNIETTIDFDVDVGFNYRKGSADHFDPGFGNWLPGDPPEVDGFKVTIQITRQALEDALRKLLWLGPSNTSNMVEVDVWDSLDESTRERIRHEALEVAVNED